MGVSRCSRCPSGENVTGNPQRALLCMQQSWRMRHIRHGTGWTGIAGSIQNEEYVMKRIVVFCNIVACTSLLLLSACSHEPVVVERQTVREVPTKSDVVVVQPQRPSTWVPGHWIQSGDTMVWQQGHWE